MFLSYITLAVALSLSVIAAYYSIAGLTAIFAAAVIPIIVMGGILEVGKVVVTLWLHEYWSRCRLLMKLYLVPAVAVLMLITSMGIFGFLSKAHSDQSLVSGDVQAKIAVYDEKIKTAKDNIDANRKALKQMDEAVDQVMVRSQDEKGADKAVALRRTQQKERARLLSEIAAEQKTISSLSEERAPIAAEVRKVEAEVGPIKYIAAMVYGENTDTNSLEAAVRWVIIMLVIVFDPLAIMMLLAATESLKWERQRLFDLLKLPVPESDVTNVNHNVAADSLVPEKLEPVGPRPQPMMFVDPGEHPKDYDETAAIEPETAVEKSLLEQHPYLTAGFAHFRNLVPMVWRPLPPPVSQDPAPPGWMFETTAAKPTTEDTDEVDEHDPKVKEAIKRWKQEHPGETIKNQRYLLQRGEIDELPWIKYLHETKSSFGTDFPTQPVKGDSFVRIDRIPSQLFKFNGSRWIEVDKNTTDNYTYDMAYIDHLIQLISQGTYDAELLTDAEQLQVANRLQQNSNI
jgi:hypothetical protein